MSQAWGNAAAALGQGLMRFAVHKENLAWEKEREANLRRLQEANLAETRRWRDSQEAMQAWEMTATKEWRATQAAQAATAQTSLDDYRTQTLAGQEAARAATEQNSKRLAALEAGTKSLMEAPDSTPENPKYATDYDDLGKRARLIAQPSAQMQLVDRMADTLRAAREEGKDPGLVGRSDNDLDMMAINAAITTGKTRPLTDDQRIEAAQGMLDSLTEQASSLALNNSEESTRQLTAIRQRMATLEQFIRETGQIAPSGSFGAGTGDDEKLSPMDRLRQQLGVTAGASYPMSGR